MQCPECGIEFAREYNAQRFCQTLLVGNVRKRSACERKAAYRREWHRKTQEAKDASYALIRERRAKMIAIGICSRCLVQEASPGLRTCSDCRDYLYKNKGN